MSARRGAPAIVRGDRAHARGEARFGDAARFGEGGLEASQKALAAPGDAQPRVVRDAAPMLEGPSFHFAPMAVDLVAVHRLASSDIPLTSSGRARAAGERAARVP